MVVVVDTGSQMSLERTEYGLKYRVDAEGESGKCSLSGTPNVSGTLL